MKQKKSFSAIFFDIAVMVLFLLIMVFTVKTIVAKAKGTVNYIFGKYAVLYVMTESMEPTIPEKSYILIEKVKPEKITEGTIISFYSDDPSIQGSLNTHRVAEVLDGEFVTKGDNNVAKDNYTAKAENIVGKYVCNIGFLTVLGNAFASKTGGLIVLLFLGITFIIAALRVFLNAKNANNEDKETDKTGENENSTESDNSKEKSEMIEEIKRKAILEYIENQQKEEENKNECQNEK